jgi:predicted phage-related endonuclease
MDKVICKVADGGATCPNDLTICCGTCEHRHTCDEVCTEVDKYEPQNCPDAEVITTDLTLFQSNAIAIMHEIAELDRQKKLLEVKDKAVRQELQEAMDKYGVKKFENDILKITYVEPTTRTTIDSARLKKELPAVAEKYTKISQVKGSVRIDVK